jgi:hypothetical protein
MANSVSIGISLNANIDGQSFLANASATQVPVNNNAITETLLIAYSATTAVLIVPTAIGTPSYVTVINLDPTNTITLYNQATIAGSATLAVIQPLGAAAIPGVAAIYAAAQVAGCQAAVTAICS